jgi:hypothetical protein
MGAGDALKKGLVRRWGFRTVGPGEASPEAATARPSRAEVLRCSYRPPDADFYCWKYGVWYNLMDCCFRHARRTYGGCAGCGQGENNLRQNRHRFHALQARRSHFAR